MDAKGQLHLRDDAHGPVCKNRAYYHPESAEQGGHEDMPTRRLETIGEDDGEHDDESEESGVFDGFGDYDAWCAKQDGHVLDSDGYHHRRQ